ncbi:MAG: 50S ribosomal protein L21 [Candidatus Levybacteria bacterium]|nr:50S ribosomal protein L21 [Candidatus Levybacteria bacterium]
MKYAVVKTGGKQYRVSEGDIISVERLDAKANDEYPFSNVLLYVSGGVLKVGTPTVEKVIVKGTVIELIKGEKIRVSKYKSKVRTRRTIGHRQLLSKVKIDKIFLEGEIPKSEKVKIETKKTGK